MTGPQGSCFDALLVFFTMLLVVVPVTVDVGVLVVAIIIVYFYRALEGES